MAPVLSFLISSWSKKKEPRCACLSEARASHSHKMWTEVSSSVPHFLLSTTLSPQYHTSSSVPHCLLSTTLPPQYHTSSSVPHFLRMGLLLSLITYKCVLRVLCPVWRPITTLDFVLLKDNYWALVARLGPEINSQACLCVLQGLHHKTKCWLSVQHLLFRLMFCLERDPQ